MNLDILVAGTGRCGSSFVSMILHQDFGVCMGHNLDIKPSTFHRWGNWEFKKPAMKLFTLVDTWQTPTEKILKAISASHPETCTNRLKGIKAPFLSQLTTYQWLILSTKFNTRLVIWSWRPAEAVIYSTIKKYHAVQGKAKDKAIAWVHRGLQNMQEAFIDPPFKVLKIDFTNEVSREELVEQLAPQVEAL